ncbi:hypothetical protein SKAU_G00369010 [Synaphobranchus kaupii]|uniref:Type I cytokine receptor cytokine-binding domain-containing protein n=1 Tax=Synaphobranchus kaupii TaxID=118154 RepID=A0A9Q1IET7_SYNKA|nr:hypothetical protein SKAU_G00369010 [Synaphobranchus kaupii]
MSDVSLDVPAGGALRYKPLRMLMAVLVLLMNICKAEHDITVDPPRNIRIIDPGHLGQLHVSWTLPASLENRTDCAVRFQLRFFNTYEGEWTTIRTREMSYDAQFDLEKNVQVRIQTMLGGPCTSGSSEVQSPAADVLLKPPVIGLPGTKIKELSCIFYQREYMDCTWQKKQKTQANYQLYFWHRKMERAMECPEYLQSHGRRTGCRFPWHSLLEFTEFNVCVNGSSAGTLLRPAYFTMQLQNHMKPAVIDTLSLETLPDGDVCLEWAPPKGRILEDCLEFEVESRPEGTEGLMARNLTRAASFTVSPPDQCFCFRTLPIRKLLICLTLCFKKSLKTRVKGRHVDSSHKHL